MTESDAKAEVLKHISDGLPISFIGKAKWRVGTNVVHVRFRSSPKSKGIIFSYNINPNTLTADYEVWICGNSQVYYLFPKLVMNAVYDDPDAYVDYQHPEIRVAEVDTSSHRLLYGRGSKSMDASPNFQKTLQTFGP